MGSASPLKDIEERFCECSICLGEFKDPKLLPCLHRYCRHCLAGVIAEEGDTFNCPICKEECTVNPKEGVDTFKTDFLMRNVVEFIAFQKSFENDDSRECIGCSKTLKVTSYCFKCKGFLCDECHRQHTTSKMFATHEQHILNLKDAAAKKLTLEKLASLTMAPRCHIHPENRGQLLCGTCDNAVVCVPCTYGKHKGHDLHEVKQFAEAEREKLIKQIAELKKYQPKLYALQERVEKVRKQLQETVAKAKAKLETQRNAETAKIDGQISKMNEAFRENRRDVERRRSKEQARLQVELEKKMRQLHVEYDGKRTQTNAEYDNEVKQLQDEYDKGEAKLIAKRKVVGEKSIGLEEKITMQQTQKKERIQEIAKYCKHTVNRYENFIATASTILQSNDEWTDAQCIPNITAANVPLMENVKRDFLDLDGLPNVASDDLPRAVIERVVISEKEELVIDVEDIKPYSREVQGITCARDGRIIVTGYLCSGLSHISIVTIRGATLHQDQIRGADGSRWLNYRVCKTMSEFKIATACLSNQVGIYNVRDGSYIKKDIRDIIKDWPVHDRYVTCVAADSVKRNIVLGSSRCKDLLVFDDELNYSHTIKLPEIIESPIDITVHKGKLILCDEGGMKACTVTMEQNAELVQEIPRYNQLGNWQPISVCTDRSSFIYMLWKLCDADSLAETVLLQYSQDGREILATREVDYDSRCITTIDTDNGEKLLVATCLTGKIFLFGLE